MDTAQQPALAIYLSREGQNFGPYSWDELCYHYQTGGVVGTDFIWFEGSPEWRPLSQFFAPEPALAQVAIQEPIQSGQAIGVVQAGVEQIQQAKPIGPLHMAQPVPVEAPLADPSSLTPVQPKPKVDQKAKGKPKNGKTAGKRQDFQLPRWVKWGVAGVIIIIGIIGLFFTGGEIENVDRMDQVIGQAVRNSINKPQGELVDADYRKATEIRLNGRGLVEVGALTKCSGVVKLNLSGNRISNVSFLLGMSKLEELDLSQNQINDFSPLKSMKSLKVLKIRGNPGATNSTLTDLKRSLPGCKIQIQ